VTTTTTTNSTIFKRYDGVVIATKLHGPHQQLLLDQSLCLLQAAYNRRVNYDIVVFYTEELNPTDMTVTEELVAPARIIWTKDNRGSLQEEIDALSPTRRRNFLQSCGTNASSSDNINWFSDCGGRVAYNWQAEFRTWHIWNHAALRPYKTMLWLDTDGFATREWHVDPIQTMIENDLNILFMNFPKGNAIGQEVHERLFKSFNVTICRLSVENGRLGATYGYSANSCPNATIPLVHGFFHITNLDFYRRPDVLKFEGMLDPFGAIDGDGGVSAGNPALSFESDTIRVVCSNTNTYADTYELQSRRNSLYYHHQKFGSGTGSANGNSTTSLQ
jgi:hypothetical protein